MIILSEKQEKAIDLMNNFIKDKQRKKPFVLLGKAGSGKSTVIDYFSKQLNLRVAYVCFTGKAALVLKKKGVPATTIHKLIYNAEMDEFTQDYIFYLKRTLDEPKDLIIIDEISMVSKEILEDIMSFNVPIIAIGDPNQLPNIGGSRNTLMDNYDIYLDEIHRQASKNTIIRIADDVTKGRAIKVEKNDDYVKIINKKDFQYGIFDWADQVICGKNDTRNTLNRQYRQSLGFESTYPEVEDKLICVKNYWKEVNKNLYPLINGTTGKVIAKNNAKIIFAPDYDINNPFKPLSYDKEIFETGVTSNKFSKYLKQLDFGYVISCHKGQGSSWEKVVVFEEVMRGDHQKWLYTAITRASEKLVLIR